MRIALFHDLPSGGAKRSLHELVRRLAVRHDIDLYSFSGTDERFCDLRPWVRERHEFAHAPARLFSRPLGRLNALQRWRDLGCLSALAARVAAAIDGRGYDVLYAEPSIWTQAPLVLLHAATPSLYQFHEPLRTYYEPRLNQRGQTRWREGLDRVDPLRALYRARLGRLDRAATRAARCVLVNSRYSRAQAHALYGVTAQVLRRGVDGERFRPAATTARRAEVLSVGALQPSKGFEFVVDSLARIPLARRPALRIIANSEVAGERAFIAQRATSQDVALHIEVGVDEARLVAAYGEAALLVYAPHHEPFGLAPLEAMACATPVVAVAEGGIPESVRDGVNGRLVERNPGAFAAAVQSLLGDPAACRRLGEQARDDVCTHWTWERSAAQLESELESIAAGGEHPPAKEHTG